MEHKEEQIRLRLSKGEKEALQAAARRKSIPVATWIRSVALAAAGDDTAHLLSSAENARQLRASISELDKGGSK